MMFEKLSFRKAQQTEASKNVNFKLGKVSMRLKAKNVFWQSKYREVRTLIKL